MNKILIEETKKVMNYVVNRSSCKNCLYSKEVIDDVGCSDLVCTYSNICPFAVEADVFCDKYIKE